jgi:hypothetical protein
MKGQRLIKIIAIALLLAFLLTLTGGLGCGPRVVQHRKWKPYRGCPASQCQSWYEECSSECLNKGGIGISQCDGQCHQFKESCLQECTEI